MARVYLAVAPKERTVLAGGAVADQLWKRFAGRGNAGVVECLIDLDQRLMRGASPEIVAVALLRIDWLVSEGHENVVH